MAITGGGSGGHTNPALALVEGWRARDGEEAPDFLYIGSHSGIEGKLAPRRRIPYASIATGKLRRHLSFENLIDLFRVPLGTFQAWLLLREFRPDSVFSTGGFVAVPVVLAARTLGLPILVHEQTVAGGLANRISARLADRVAVTFASSASHFPSSKVVVTGIPIRPALFEGQAHRYLESSGFDAARPILYATGGSQGSRALNEALWGCLPDLLEHVQIAHQCGRSQKHRMVEEARVRAASLPPELAARYQPFDYLDGGLEDLLSATRVLLGRSGAGTVCEVMALGLPSILVPLPKAAGDEQRKNAQILADAGAALVLEEKDLTPETLKRSLLELIEDEEALRIRGARARELFVSGGLENLIDQILSLSRQR